jgi:hypothetical protein
LKSSSRIDPKMSLVPDMPILTTKQTWSRKPRRLRGRGTTSLEERANIRKALLFLAARYTSPDRLAEALGLSRDALWKARSPRHPPSVRLAALVARAEVVNLEDVLTGAWPGDSCPKCGRCG